MLVINSFIIVDLVHTIYYISFGGDGYIFATASGA